MSYAGYTAPLLARRVLDGNKNFRLNLKVKDIRTSLYDKFLG